MAEDAGPALTAPQDGSTNATANDGINGGGAPLLMSSFFPSPPSFSASFTPENLKLAARLVAHADFKAQAEDWKAQQESILSELDVPAEEIKQVEELDLRTLVQPPDIDLFEEEGHWNAFGQTWPVKEALPTLEEMGVKQLYKSPNNFDGKRKGVDICEPLQLTFTSFRRPARKPSVPPSYLPSYVSPAALIAHYRTALPSKRRSPLQSRRSSTAAASSHLLRPIHRSSTSVFHQHTSSLQRVEARTS